MCQGAGALRASANRESSPTSAGSEDMFDREFLAKGSKSPSAPKERTAKDDSKSSKSPTTADVAAW